MWSIELLSVIWGIAGGLIFMAGMAGLAACLDYRAARRATRPVAWHEGLDPNEIGVDIDQILQHGARYQDKRSALRLLRP
jgi:hypothetical protein